MKAGYQGTTFPLARSLQISTIPLKNSPSPAKRSGTFSQLAYICFRYTAVLPCMFRILFLFLYLLLPGLSKPVAATTYFGTLVPDERIDSVYQAELEAHPLLRHKDNYFSVMERPRPFKSKNSTFLMAIGLLVFAGLFRLSNPAYFKNVFRAFANHTLSSRQLRDQLSQSNRAGFFMNLLFCLSIAFYLLELSGFFQLPELTAYGYFEKAAFLTLGLALLFLLRYAVIRLSGWVFGLEDTMDHYLFNALLGNKVLGLLLLPFTIILSLGEGEWVQVAVLISFIIIGFTLIHRYVRSWGLFSFFFKAHKVHFFLYLCASEILPAALLVKLLSLWL